MRDWRTVSLLKSRIRYILGWPTLNLINMLHLLLFKHAVSSTCRPTNPPSWRRGWTTYIGWLCGIWHWRHRIWPWSNTTIKCKIRHSIPQIMVLLLLRVPLFCFEILPVPLGKPILRKAKSRTTCYSLRWMMRVTGILRKYPFISRWASCFWPMCYMINRGVPMPHLFRKSRRCLTRSDIQRILEQTMGCFTQLRARYCSGNLWSVSRCNILENGKV